MQLSILLALAASFVTALPTHRRKIEVCKPDDCNNPFVVAVEPRVPYNRAHKICKELRRQLPLIDQTNFIPAIELQQDCLGCGSLAWVGGDVTEYGCPALLTTSDEGTFTYVNCEAWLPVICEKKKHCYGKDGKEIDC